jgi:ketosteroid isomerase-like protein
MTDPGNFTSHTVPSLMKRLWVHGFLVGLGLVLAVLLAWWLLWGTPAPPTTAEKEAVSAAPGDAAVLLKSQVNKVLTGILEANLKKDLAQVMGYYASSFPHRRERADRISKSWELYDFLNLDFKIDEVKALGPDLALAQVTWEIETRNRKTRSLNKVTKTYLVWLARDNGQWQIQALENLAGSQEEQP